MPVTCHQKWQDAIFLMRDFLTAFAELHFKGKSCLLQLGMIQNTPYLEQNLLLLNLVSFSLVTNLPSHLEVTEVVSEINTSLKRHHPLVSKKISNYKQLFK